MSHKTRRSTHGKSPSVVYTVDGPGKIIAREMRKNTNGGPGTRQARVRLEDGRIRHYPLTGLRDESGNVIFETKDYSR